ncbi:MAG TPA: protease pro-enzyme activation domain-containing protein [Streptosporangiaceae bacterium]
MSRQRWLASLGATATLAGLTIVSFTGTAGASPSSQTVRLAGSVAPFTSSRAIAPVSGALRISVQVWLKPDLAGAARYAIAVSTPGNTLFHRYLSPAAFTAKYGASKAAAAKVESWLRGQGFSAVHTDAQRNYVRATGSVSTINAAFKVRMTNYRRSNGVNAGLYTLRSNDRPVAIPAALGSSVLGVTGLDNAAVQLPLEGQSAKPRSPNEASIAAQASTHRRPAPCSRWYGQHFARHMPKHFGVTQFPTQVCGYGAIQLRAAYEMNFKSTGRHQTVALVELGLAPEMFQTLTDYAARMHMPAPTTNRYAELSLGRNTCGDPFFVEEQLDVEAAYDMAPGANQLVVGGDACNNGDFGLQGLFNADIAILNGTGRHPLASIASNSWEGATEEQPPGNTKIETGFLVRAAAEGVGMYFSAGDGSGALSPSDSPYAISVGGTTLGIGQHLNRLFETGWSTGESFLTVHHGWIFVGEQGASGGGPSLLWAQPRFQKGVVPTKMATAPGNRAGLIRSAPDISADADPFTGFAVGLLVPQRNPNKPLVYLQIDIGGTSEAAPLVAGIVAAAQQGQRPFGLIDPALYRLAGTSALHDALPVTSHTPVAFRGVACNPFICGFQVLTQFDDQSNKMFGYFGQVTAPGYDNMTGVGTPRGQAFIRALRALES